jgi:hypothetical protein
MTASKTLRSQSTDVFLTKLWAPLICFVATLGIFGGEFPTWRFLFASPLILAALFGLSVAVVEVRDGVLRYRRFLRWTVVPRGDVISSGVVWPGFIGYLRLRRPIFPWGRLYFALDENLDPNPFRRGDYRLLRFLRSERVHEFEQIEKAALPGKKIGRAYGLAFAVGMASSFLFAYLSQNSARPAQQDYPATFRIIIHFWQIIEAWPWGVLTVVLLGLLVLRQPFSKHNWILAWALGFMVAQMAVIAIH